LDNDVERETVNTSANTAARATIPSALSVTAVVNHSARQAGIERAEWLKALRRERYAIEADILLPCEVADIHAQAKRAAQGSSDLIVAAGGDGTINTVAAGLVGTDKCLGILPLGTLNHFAKDLGIPLDPQAAAENLIEGRARAVDVASVNGQVFLNNSSLGIYPRLVSAREEHEQKVRSKWIAWLPALWQTLRRYPILAIRLSTEGHALVRRTPIVFVGNNAYELEGWGIGSRTCLDDGTLQVSVLRHAGRWSLVRMFLCAFFGRLGAVKEFDSLCAPELWVEARRKHLHVSLDGEVMTLKTPLHYQIHARALRVMVPK